MRLRERSDVKFFLSIIWFHEIAVKKCGLFIVGSSHITSSIGVNAIMGCIWAKILSF